MTPEDLKGKKIRTAESRQCRDGKGIWGSGANGIL